MTKLIELPYDNTLTTLKALCNELEQFAQKSTVSKDFWYNHFRWIYYKRVYGIEDGAAETIGNCLERIGINNGSILTFKILDFIGSSKNYQFNHNDVLAIAVFYNNRWYGLFKAFNRNVTTGVIEVGTRYIDESKNFNLLVPIEAVFGVVTAMPKRL